MATKQEERYPGVNHVSDLRRFLRGKVRHMNELLATCKAKDEKKVKSYISMVTEILALDYFKKDINVYTLMKCLKAETFDIDETSNVIKEEIKELDRQIEEKQMELCEDESLIPDEQKDFLEARRHSVAALRLKRYQLDEYLHCLEREKNLLHNLKGIICRPEGFFSKL